MIDWNSVRLPIVIFSTARSGSSALANHIHRKVNDVMLFEEPEFIKTPKPKNYEEVYHAVSKMYSTLNI